MYDKYIGLPYLENGRTETGLDCWGLAKLFYKNELGIDLPSYDTEYNGSYDPNVVAAISHYKSNWKKTDTPKPGNLCLFNILGEPTHIGVYIGNNKFMHARDGQDTVVESLLSSNWNRRFEGFYEYSPKHDIVQFTGAPHPFKTQVVYDWIASGSTVAQCVKFIQEKYKISERLVKQIVILLDGKPVDKNQWEDTVIQPGQVVTYKSIPQGRSFLRYAIIIIAYYIAGEYGAKVGAEIAAATGMGLNTATYIAQAAIIMAGTQLAFAIAPIRPPSTSTPDQGQGLNFFTGANNRPNPYGPIPIVLGALRYTPPLGSVPYVESQSTTSFMNLQLVWGFGPLAVSDLYIGANKIDNYYQNKLETQLPRPVTVAGFVDTVKTSQTYGSETETTAIAEFNKMYPNIVEQQFKNVELANYGSDNNTETITFAETAATKVEAILSFPEGMRQINTKDGKTSATSVTFQVTLTKLDSVTNQPEPNQSNNILLLASNYENVLTAAYYRGYSTNNEGEDIVVANSVYLKTTYCLNTENSIIKIQGTGSLVKGQNPSSGDVSLFISTGYANLVGTQSNYSFEPVIPNGVVKLYSIIQYGSTIDEIQDHINSNFGYTGLQLVTSPILSTFFTGGEGDGSPQPTGNWTVTIAKGKVDSKIATAGSPVPTISTSELIFSSRNFTNVTNVTTGYGSFLNTHGVWYGSNTTFDQQTNVDFKYDGVYTIEASADDEAEIFIDGLSVLKTGTKSKNGSIAITKYISKGLRPVRVTATNFGGGQAVALQIRYFADNITNIVPSTNTFITIGDNEFVNHKDGFNYPIVYDNLQPGKYSISIRRDTTSDADYFAEHKQQFKSIFLSAACFKSGTTIQPPKHIGICRTAIRLESSGKVNGTVDGVNAYVQTLGWDYVLNPTTGNKEWVNYRPTNNPASLFVHILTHPANAYRIKTEDIQEKIDILKIQEWHTFCSTVTSQRPALTYNGLITSTASVMDALRDVCAAGLASPAYVDGKWTVVIDKPRTHVVQHFTPHNSNGFESTKLLPRLPDGFRISIPDESNGFQPYEMIVANFGKTEETVEILEQLNLPGITNKEQAKFFARWHFAQLYYRPEIYSINVDFEYLVCTRGDLVRVTHDVPLWGSGSGRVKQIVNTTKIILTEPVYLETGKNYQIRFRTNNLTSTIGSGSVLQDIVGVNTSNYYTTIDLAQSLDSAVQEDNLFMVGQVNKVTQELIVISIEPTTNTTAKITLVDYSPAIYSLDLVNGMPAYDANITKRIASEVVQNSIVTAPVNLSAQSSSDLAESGLYMTTTIITYNNPRNLPATAEKVEFQIVLGNESFTNTKQSGAHLINKDAGSYRIGGLTIDTPYKIRARYRNASGTISGPWSDELFHVVTGNETNPFVPTDIKIKFTGTNIIVTPVIAGGVEPADHKTYEFRLYRTSQLDDFWDDPWDPLHMLKSQSRTQAVFDLRDLPLETTVNGVTTKLSRLSNAGVNYTIICRALNNTNRYSATSAKGSILIKTIQ